MERYASHHSLSRVRIMISWWHVLELVTLVLAILALAAGIIHLLELRKTAEALSTRFIGKFPLFLPAIIDLINEGRKEVIIACDVAGYGAFTDPGNGLAYRQALERQVQRGCRVELTCMTAEKRNLEALEVLTKSDWPSWKKRHMRDVVAFLSTHSAVAEPAALSREQFVSAMSDADDEILHHLFRKDTLRLSEDMPLYFWIVDHKTAIFSIPAVAQEIGEYGFRTSDHALIQ